MAASLSYCWALFLSLSLSLSLSREARGGHSLKLKQANSYSQAGFGSLGLLIWAVIISLAIGGGFWLSQHPVSNSNFQSLQAQVQALEDKNANQTLTGDDLKNLDALGNNVKALQQKTDNLPADTNASLDDLLARIDKLRDGTIGPKGDKGDTGASGSTGATGAAGAATAASCANGSCLSLQSTSPGTVETGNVNVSGNIRAGILYGNGAGVTGVDASYLAGYNSGYYTNASNVSSGTLADGRLSTNVSLLGQTIDTNEITNNTIVNADISGTAAIDYTKLNLTGNIVNADISPTAAIAYSKLNLATSIVNADIAVGAAIAYSKLTLANSVTNDDLAGSIADTKLSTISTAGKVADSALSANVALLDGSQTFSGSPLFKNLANSATAFRIQNADGSTTLLSANTTTATITIATLTVTNNLTVSGSAAVTGSITFGTTLAGSCAGLAGYVWVPGSAKFGTLPGFCVMKYEAKDDGSGNAVSTASGTPWVSISQRTAEDEALAACAGCHLITEAEWMTIATNALWVNANWCDLTGTNCDNTPGTAGRYLATGHQDNSPAAALAASATDSEACYGTVTADTNTACGAAGTQKRTLTLSNGAIVWDIPGNVWEWTDAWIIGNEEPNDAVDGFAYHEFTAVTKWKDLNYANPTNRGWNSSQRIGQIYTDGTSTNNTLYGFLRGGAWGNGTNAGAFALNLGNAPTLTGTSIGFRVAR